MKLFGRKDKEKTQQTCSRTLVGSVVILGSGCSKCNQLEAAVRTALEQLGMEATIEHITDFSQIAAYGVMTTPALVVNGKVVSYGKVLKTGEAKKLLLQAAKKSDFQIT